MDSAVPIPPAHPASRATAASPPACRPLVELRTGEEAVLVATDVPRPDRQLLLALGLAPGRTVRLCKRGGPWILEVRGIRVGLASAVAERLLVRPA